jgi:putative heme-binding domain-containing protein
LVKNKMSDQPSAFPRRLSETGLFAATSTLTPAAGVHSYQPIVSAWQDGATSNFVVGIPGAESIRINRQQRNWDYPAGTVFAKTLSRDSRRLETQLLHFDGINWHPYSYLWNEEQTDARLVEHAGTTLKYQASQHTEVAEDKSWAVLNRAQCRACHSRQNGGAVGFTLENLAADQVNRFVEDGVLDRRAPEGWNIAKMVDPHNPRADLEARARSYLAANCAHCHRRGGGGTVPMDLAYSTSPDEFRAIDVEPTQGAFGMDDARVICPGDPYRSTLFYRLATSGTGHMPKVWTRDNDVDGLMLVHDWIRSLAPNPSDSATSDSAEGQSNGTSEALRRFAHLLRLDADDAGRLERARLAVAEGDAVSSALFERFLPPGERRKRLGNQIDTESILAMQGNARRGQSRFLEAAAQQCNLCHRVGGQGRSVGPDLDGIGSKRTARELLESLLEPSKVIDPKYTNHLVVTDDGRVVSGLLVEEDDQWLVVRSADGKDQRIARETIESRRLQRESVMPQGLAAEMTADELADLLAYLTSLK